MRHFENPDLNLDFLKAPVRNNFFNYPLFFMITTRNFNFKTLLAV